MRGRASAGVFRTASCAQPSASSSSPALICSSTLISGNLDICCAPIQSFVFGCRLPSFIAQPISRSWLSLVSAGVAKTTCSPTQSGASLGTSCLVFLGHELQAALDENLNWAPLSYTGASVILVPVVQSEIRLAEAK